MKSEITQRTNTDTTLTISLDQAYLESIYQNTLRRLKKNLKVAGFRPGKAPDNIVERELGSTAIQNEVIDAAVKEGYATAVKKHDLPVIASPEVSISKFVPFTELEFSAQVAVMPEVALPDYNKIKARPTAVSIAEDEVDRVLLDLQRRMANRLPVDRSAKIGDEINLDFEGFKEGQAVSGASSKSYDLVLGSESFIPGFEAQLVGLKAGTTKEFDITFPKNYGSADLAGQKLLFKVTINQVNQIDLPNINTDFVQKVSPLKTVEELKSDIKNRITEEKKESSQRQFENAVLNELLELTKFESPKVLLDQQMARLKADLEARLAGEGLDLEKYAKMQNQTPAQIEADLHPEAAKRVKLAVLLTEIARAEGLKVTLDEVEAELARLRALYSDPQMQTELKEPSIKEEIYNHLLATKTVKRILTKVAPG